MSEEAKWSFPQGIEQFVRVAMGLLSEEQASGQGP